MKPCGPGEISNHAAVFQQVQDKGLKFQKAIWFATCATAVESLEFTRYIIRIITRA